MDIDPYETGMLDPNVHHRLVADIERYARAARITPEWIWRPITDVCSAEETAWARQFRFHQGEGRSGLIYVGRDPCPQIEDRLAAIAGALIRNFIDARVLTLLHLLDAIHDGEIPEFACLLVPTSSSRRAAKPAGGSRHCSTRCCTAAISACRRCSTWMT
jgi:hypothetical protein